MEKKSLYKVIFPLVVIAIWEIFSIWLKKPAILPRVESVLIILIHPTQKILGIGNLLESTIVSIVRVICGFFLAVIVALPLGILMGYFKRVREITTTLIELLRPIPPLAWIPLALAWFGLKNFGDLLGIKTYHPILENLQIAMIFIIFIGAFFPILLNTIHGVKGVKIILIESAISLGARDKDILKKVILPSASPSILTGLRMGFGIAWMCVVAAEMLPGSNYGLGYLISHAYDIARIDVVIGGMIIIGIIGVITNTIFELFERKMFKWRAKGY